MHAYGTVFGLICAGGLSFARLAVADEPARDAGHVVAQPRQPAGTTRKPLDLRVPDIRQLLSQREIDRVLSASRDPDTIEEVEVAGERGRELPVTPDIPPGLFAPFWAIAHPTQAWRIFAPLPPDRAKSVGNRPPDATDPQRPPPVPHW